jgi:hypothetical protein
MNTQKPSAQIPGEIVEIARRIGENYSERREAEFSQRSATAGFECAIEMYRHLSPSLGGPSMRFVKKDDFTFPVHKSFFVRRTDNDSRSVVELDGLRLVDGYENVWGYTTDPDIEYLDESSSPAQPAGVSVRDVVAMREAFQKYISILAEENFVLRKKIIQIKDECWDPTTLDSVVKKIDEGRKVLSDALRTIFPIGESEPLLQPPAAPINPIK